MWKKIWDLRGLHIQPFGKIMGLVFYLYAHRVISMIQGCFINETFTRRRGVSGISSIPLHLVWYKSLQLQFQRVSVVAMYVLSEWSKMVWGMRASLRVFHHWKWPIELAIYNCTSNEVKGRKLYFSNGLCILQKLNNKNRGSPSATEIGAST